MISRYPTCFPQPFLMDGVSFGRAGRAGKAGKDWERQRLTKRFSYSNSVRLGVAGAYRGQEELRWCVGIVLLKGEKKIDGGKEIW